MSHNLALPRTMAAKDQLAVFMDPGEFSQLLAATYALCPKQVLEWGSGGSTKALLDRCEFIQHYVSIEHDALWYEKVRSLVHDPRLRLEHVPADKPLQIVKPKQKETESWYALAEADPSVMKTYVEFPRRLG